uniref:Uncharacterized protein n=1 Tax=Kalanchoe fedtschenkoi TaxID=63787 RepID=A0A7N0T1G4_KALFE
MVVGGTRCRRCTGEGPLRFVCALPNPGNVALEYESFLIFFSTFIAPCLEMVMCKLLKECIAGMADHFLLPKVRNVVSCQVLFGKPALVFKSLPLMSQHIHELRMVHFHQ